ncbi:hypothetical protein A2572_02115 [Candidatus Collierbacteria bacterium RIFOXYD1_FULL_40_9]|uniref:Uncharacterized protein n=1 Tax=Candidatus Collierbacteria bacterium RIFOXYD1_FULL_40_9 TaxID=1817731 RepID=A0A1F5FT61_9BACT|nr:MAG: hypothetical protein A2572_02115 [Candidatus Collierbacteria bacterium RIFOXYD1_FULL_40_9]
MDQNAIARYAKLILSMPKASEADEKAKAVCDDIIGKIKTNEKPVALKKISEVLTQCKIDSTEEETRMIYDEIRSLI